MDKRELIKELKKALRQEPESEFLQSLDRQMAHWSKIEESLKGRKDVIEELRHINDKYSHIQELYESYRKTTERLNDSL